MYEGIRNRKLERQDGHSTEVKVSHWTPEQIKEYFKDKGGVRKVEATKGRYMELREKGLKEKECALEMGVAPARLSHLKNIKWKLRDWEPQVKKSGEKTPAQKPSEETDLLKKYKNLEIEHDKLKYAHQVLKEKQQVVSKDQPDYKKKYEEAAGKFEDVFKEKEEMKRLYMAVWKERDHVHEEVQGLQNEISQLNQLIQERDKQSEQADVSESNLLTEMVTLEEERDNLCETLRKTEKTVGKYVVEIKVLRAALKEVL